MHWFFYIEVHFSIITIIIGKCLALDRRNGFVCGGKCSFNRHVSTIRRQWLQEVSLVSQIWPIHTRGQIFMYSIHGHRLRPCSFVNNTYAWQGYILLMDIRIPTIEILVCLNKHIHIKYQDVIIYPCPRFNCSLVKSPWNICLFDTEKCIKIINLGLVFYWYVWL